MVCRIFCAVTLLVLYDRVNDANGCGPDPCPGMVCLYGKAIDTDGCPVCGCYDPCFDFRCQEGYRCLAGKIDNTNTFTRQCVPTVTKPPCPPVSCSNTCYRYKTDDRGCQSCECWDPCQGNPCGANRRCEIEDCFYADACIDYAHKCVDASGIPAVTTRPARELTTIRQQTLEERLQAAMRQCCTSAISYPCFKNCSTDPTKLLSDFSTCFPYPKIWDYLHCISASKPSETIWKPSEMNGEIVKHTRPKGRELAGMHDLLGNLIGRVGSKILKYHLNEKEFVQERETDIEAETKPETEAEAETEPEIVRDVQECGYK